MKKCILNRMLPLIDKPGTADKIIYFMKINNLNPKDVQGYLELTCVQTVYRWLEGINIPTIDNLYALSQLFGIQIDDMIAGSRSPHEEEPILSQGHRLQIYYNRFFRKAA